MCGIIGYVGSDEDAVEKLYDGLKRLEYRGYDSCGSAVFDKDDGVLCQHHLGAPSDIENISNLFSSCGIAHTRWATHGAVSLDNAHPHKSQNGEVYVVHNGVIENCDKIKDRLHYKEGYADGFNYRSETDTEALVNLIAFYYEKCSSRPHAIKLALSETRGTYGLAVIFKDKPNKIYAAKRSSPLVLGIGEGEHYNYRCLPAGIDPRYQQRTDRACSFSKRI